MSLFGVESWIKSPADRDIIRRWTVGAPNKMTYALELPPPPDPEHFSFIALGETGDSDAAGPRLSPQDAVAREMAADASLEDGQAGAHMILHMGDIVYMTGERRLYDRNFRRPYAPFLMPESTVDNLVFNLPFLPIPGNHDYYDLRGWVQWLARVPILGSGVQAVIHELFAFSMPEGGSEMGRAYMQAFINEKADTSAGPLNYVPRVATRLPNRYYKFSIGQVDFFALDSNTLDAPPPGTIAAGEVAAEAGQLIEKLEAQSKKLDGELRKYQRILDQWRKEERDRAGEDSGRREALNAVAMEVQSAFSQLAGVLETAGPLSNECGQAHQTVKTALQRWTEGYEDLQQAVDPAAIVRALEALEEASDDGCNSLLTVESCLGLLPESPARSEILAARDRLEKALHKWSEVVTPMPADLCDTLHNLSEQALDIQRDLALEKRRQKSRPEDYDVAQLQWLEESLAESERTNPGGWRIVYLHHPFYSTIANHCERPDVQSVRSNLLDMLRNRVHLILSGHSHAFEWFRSDWLPNTGLFVTGGGGQISLRRSLLDPKLYYRYRERYDSLRHHGVVECAASGRGPIAADGADGKIYHYIKVDVTPDALVVRPVGVRRLTPTSYRREEPMPVFHASELPNGRPPWESKLLKSVSIYRDRPPVAEWE
jgi:hypothetical protein